MLRNILLNESEKTYSIAERLFTFISNDELNWTPAEGKNWMTVGQLLMHCSAFGCGKAIQGFVKGDWGLHDGKTIEELIESDHTPSVEELPRVKSVEAAIELLKEDKKLTINCLKEVDEARLLSEHLKAPWGGEVLPLFHHLLQMIVHLVHHKGQLYYYIKLMGKNVSSNDLWEVNNAK
jgi:hypothetical protein